MIQGLVQGLIATVGILWAMVTACLAVGLFSPEVDSPLGERLARLPHPLGFLVGLVLAALWPVWVAAALFAMLVAIVVQIVAGLALDLCRRRP
jgi:hypothetical protein